MSSELIVRVNLDQTSGLTRHATFPRLTRDPRRAWCVTDMTVCTCDLGMRYVLLQNNVLRHFIITGQGCEAGDLQMHPGCVAKYDEDVREDSSNSWAAFGLTP